MRDWKLWLGCAVVGGLVLYIISRNNTNPALSPDVVSTTSEQTSTLVGVMNSLSNPGLFQPVT